MKKILIFLIGISLITLTISLALNYCLLNKKDIKASSEINENCLNLTLVYSANCLRNELSTFFKFNISEIHSEYNLSRMKEYGGVCWQWSRWWKENMIGLGFKSDTEQIWFNETEGHEYARAYIDNKDGTHTYCILDQLDINCGNIGVKNEI